MKSFKDLSVGRKVMTALLFVIAVAIVNSVIGVYFLNTTNEQLNDIVNVEAKKIALAAHIQRDMIEVNRAEKNIILATSQEGMDVFASNSEESLDEVRQSLINLRELADDEGLRLLDEFEATWEQYLEYNRTVCDLTREDSTWRAVLLSFGEARNALTTAEALLSVLVAKLDVDLDAFHSTHEIFSEAHELNHEKVMLTARIKQNLLAMSCEGKNLILAQDAENQQAALAAFEAEREELNERLERLQELLDEEGQGMLNAFAVAMDEWYRVSGQVRELAVADTNKKAIALSQGEGRVAFEAATALMAQKVDKTEADMVAGMQAAAVGFRLAMTLMISVSVVGIILGLLLVQRLSRSISSRLELLVAATERVAGGDLSQFVTEKARDEVGSLAAAFNWMTAELQETQEQLVRTEKLAVLGELAAGVGHELRNPLSAIKNAAYFLNMVLKEPDPRVQEILEILEKEVGTTERIISSLLDFARPKPVTLRKAAVNDLVRKALARTPPPDGVAVVADLDEPLPVILADPDRLSQVFDNVILNAIQAMPKGGTLEVKSALGSPSWIVIAFTDSGAGIPTQDGDKVFEPLFTTKAKGIGLGLAIARTIVEDHGGTIEASSEVGKWTTFTISLPVCGKVVEGHGDE